MTDKRRPAQPRADRVLPGVWRLRLPLPWPGVPHGNAWAVASDDGITLFDTGIGGEGRLANLEAALRQTGFGLSDVKLVVCTHTHADHYGLAGPIMDAAGCELWVHPAWDHVRRFVEDPEGSLHQRIEVARQSGSPPKRSSATARRARASRRRSSGWCRLTASWSPGWRCPRTWGRGRSTRPPGTRRPTSACTSPTGGC